MTAKRGSKICCQTKFERVIQMVWTQNSHAVLKSAKDCDEILLLKETNSNSDHSMEFQSVKLVGTPCF